MVTHFNPKPKSKSKKKKTKSLNLPSVGGAPPATLTIDEEAAEGLPMWAKHIILGVTAFGAGYVVSKFF